MTLETLMRRDCERMTLRYACARSIYCNACGAVLDAQSAVFATDGDRGALVLCARCWGRAPLHGKFGSVEVLDGRLLFPRSTQAIRARRRTRRKPKSN